MRFVYAMMLIILVAGCTAPAQTTTTTLPSGGVTTTLSGGTLPQGSQIEVIFASSGVGRVTIRNVGADPVASAGLTVAKDGVAVACSWSPATIQGNGGVGVCDMTNDGANPQGKCTSGQAITVTGPDNSAQGSCV